MSNLNNALQESLIKMDKELKQERENNDILLQSIRLHLKDVQREITFASGDAANRFNQVLLMLDPKKL